MSGRVRALALLFVPLLTGCAARAEEGQQLGLGQSLVQELTRVRDVVGLRSLLVFAACAAAVLLIDRGLRGLTWVTWRLGFDANRRLETWAAAGRLVVLVSAVIIAARVVSRTAPILVGMGLALALVGLVLGYAKQLPGIVAGITMLLRRQIRHGDRIRIAEHTGTVREVSLTRLHLRRGDGATLFVPNRLLTSDVLTVEHAKNSEVVRVRLPFASPQTPEQLELARRIANLSPFRVPGSPVEIGPTADDAHAHEVELRTWSQRTVEAAQRQVAQQLAAHMEEQADE